MMRIKKNVITGITMMFMFLFIMTCESLENPFLDDLPSEGLGNTAPETHLFLTFAPDRIDTVLSDTTTDTTFVITRYLADTTTSYQVLYWWGEDPDGEVIAYHYKWNFEDSWTRTTAESDTFFLPLQISYDEFLFQVKAEDNEGELDPSPATLHIPVANSHPEIVFANNSNPTAGTNPNVTHITFPTRTFAWSVSDIDGLETINQIRFRLDSTSSWSYRPGNVSSVTLTDIPPGYHTFYVQAIDTAGAYSNLLQFPDSTDAASPNGWRVIEPVGDVLLIDDYKLDDGSTHTFYKNILDSLVGIDNYSELELGYDEKALPGATTDQVAMFNYFKTVVWYHYSEAPSLPGADGALRTYLEAGGNVFISSIFINPDYTFTSIDSNWVINPSGRMITGLDINMVDLSITDSTVTLPSLSLRTSALIARRVSAFYPGNLIDGETSQDLFILQDARNSNDSWTGNPPVAQLFRPSPGSGQSIFFSLPLHLCDGNENIIPIMDYLLFEVFE
jgi:hypothetical protein